MIGSLTNCLVAWFVQTVPTAPYCRSRKEEPTVACTSAGNSGDGDGANHGNRKHQESVLSSFCEGISKKKLLISFVYVGASNLVATQQSCMSRNQPRIQPQVESVWRSVLHCSSLSGFGHCGPHRRAESAAEGVIRGRNATSTLRCGRHDVH
jgi:hypothetical protein